MYSLLPALSFSSVCGVQHCCNMAALNDDKLRLRFVHNFDVLPIKIRLCDANVLELKVRYMDVHIRSVPFHMQKRKSPCSVAPFSPGSGRFWRRNAARRLSCPAFRCCESLVPNYYCMPVPDITICCGLIPLSCTAPLLLLPTQVMSYASRLALKSLWVSSTRWHGLRRPDHVR